MKHVIIILFAGLFLGSVSLNPTKDLVVSGVVTDAASGDLLIGVSIQVVGSKRGTVSALDGTYLLLLEPEDKVLIFSHAGYINQRVKVGYRKTINVQLSQSTTLDEVAVAEFEHSNKNSADRADQQVISQVASKAVYQGVPSIYTPEDWNTEDYDFIRENAFVTTSDQVTSTFSIDVDRASYSNMRRFILAGTAPPADAIRIEEMINYFDYTYPEPKTNKPVALFTELGICPWQPAHQLLQVGVQSKEIDVDNLPASNLVFLIDVSGSMQAENKLPLLISSFRLLVNQLRPQDRISLVTYAGASAVVLEGKSGQYRSDILAALEQLKAGGSTAGAQGIITAYEVAKKYFIKGGNNRVVLATDGDFNIGVSSDGDLVRLIEKQRDSDIFLSVLGFGMGNYKDNKMQKLADHGNGNHNYIDNLTEAKKVFVHEFGGLYTIAKDVKIQIEFNPAKVAGYRLVGYENRRLENRDFVDDKKDAGELGVGHQVTALYEIIPAGLESGWLVSVEKRYGKPVGRSTDAFQNEVAHLRVRYKDPGGSESKLITQPVESPIQDAISSENFNWAAAVAGFGMLLRDSEFKQNTTLEKVLQIADANKGKDELGYRAEFIYLLHKFKDINRTLPTEEEVSNR